MATVYSSETQYAESTYRPVAMTDSYDREPYEYGGQPELVRDSKRGCASVVPVCLSVEQSRGAASSVRPSFLALRDLPNDRPALFVFLGRR
mmetsp:Transcript_24206/g.78081  ORF Transcript_24206/g.78081 Transcript_24206/m.78081 type:complete len:91 (+) Transcript_24206:87-359(+)